MSVISLRLNKQEEETIKAYAEYTGKSISELLKSALFVEIEDRFDYEEGVKAFEEYKANPITYSIEDVIMELEDDI